MLLNLDNFIDKVNEQLPPEIRVMGKIFLYLGFIFKLQIVSQFLG